MTSSIRKPFVYVVDDDADVLGSLRFLLETDGFEVRTFRSSKALLDTPTAPIACHRLQNARDDWHQTDRCFAKPQDRCSSNSLLPVISTEI
jgi:hypothetical protein